jgi:hypothetical protein
MTTQAAAPATGTTPTGTAETTTQDPSTTAPAVTAPAVTADTKPTEPVKGEVKAEEGDLLTADEPTKDTKNGSDASAAEIEIKVPEGVEIDQGLLDAFKPMAKELGLDSAKAQKIVDLHTNAVKAQNERAEAAWNEQKQAWRNAASSDKEIGGEKFTENVKLARTAIDKFGGPGLKQALNDLGIGNHPEIIRFAMRIGKAISEDSVTLAGTRPSTATDAEAKLRAAYPSMHQQSE